MSVPSETTGPASFSLKQSNNNAETNAYMGMPFKPATMTQGSEFALGRQGYINNVVFPSGSQQYIQQTQLSKKKKFNNSSGEQINKRKMNAIGKSSINQKS